MIAEKEKSQNLVDITLKTLTINDPVCYPSKISCEVHFGNNTIKIPIQPTIRNGVATFYEERQRIPFQNQIDLVFKLTTIKKQIELGRYQIQCHKYLQNQGQLFQQNQKLQQSDAIINFEVKIIKKQIILEEQQSDEEQLSQESLIKVNKCYSQIQYSFHEDIDSKNSKSALFGSSFRIIKKQNIPDMTTNPQQFSKILASAQDILSKNNPNNQKENAIEQEKKISLNPLNNQIKQQKILIKPKSFSMYVAFVILIVIIGVLITFFAH